MADASAQRAGPYRSIAALMNRVDTVLRESVGLGIGFGRYCLRVDDQMRKSTMLSSEPHIICAACNGIDDIRAEICFQYAMRPAVAHPKKTALHRSRPNSTI